MIMFFFIFFLFFIFHFSFTFRTFGFLNSNLEVSGFFLMGTCFSGSGNGCEAGCLRKKKRDCKGSKTTCALWRLPR